MNNWMNAFFTMARGQNLTRLFGKKRNSRGIMWISLLGLGISAAAIRLRKNKTINTNAAMRNIMNNILSKNNVSPNMANAILELSGDITPKNDNHTKK